MHNFVLEAGKEFISLRNITVVNKYILSRTNHKRGKVQDFHDKLRVHTQ